MSQDSLQTPHGAPVWHGTTILGVRKGGQTVIAGDGQVSLGNAVIKHTARKVRRIGEKQSILAGFAGATADAFTLFERLESKLAQHPNQLARAAVELAKDWRTDRYLRRLEAMLLVADASSLLVISGNGDVLEPEDGVMGIGSGGLFAMSAAKALMTVDSLTAREVAERSMRIAGDICVFTNDRVILETL